MYYSGAPELSQNTAESSDKRYYPTEGNWVSQNPSSWGRKGGGGNY